MDVVTSLREAARSAGLGVPEVAARAGLSRATAYRIFEGTTSPRVSDLLELYRALGLDIALTVTPLHDSVATFAARELIEGDPSEPPLREDSPAEALWRARLARFGRGDPVAVLREAGVASSVLRDPSSVGLRAERVDVDRLVSAGRSSGRSWALSGWAALSAMGHDIEAPTIVWTEDVRLTTQLLADTMSVTPLDRADVILSRGDADIFERSITVEDVVLVDSFQALVDGVGLGGEAERVALQIAEGLR